MSDDPSHAAFLRKVAERHAKLKDELERLLAALVENNQDRKIQKAREFLEALQNFRESLDASIHPPWIQALVR